jgi:hypothetical protein
MMRLHHVPDAKRCEAACHQHWPERPGAYEKRQKREKDRGGDRKKKGKISQWILLKPLKQTRRQVNAPTPAVSPSAVEMVRHFERRGNRCGVTAWRTQLGRCLLWLIISKLLSYFVRNIKIFHTAQFWRPSRHDDDFFCPSDLKHTS